MKVILNELAVLRGIFKNAIFSQILDDFSKALGLRTRREFRNHLVQIFHLMD